MLAYHEHNEARMVPRALDRIEAGEDLALVSDAGTPLVSDPGARLVSAALEVAVPVVPIPGPSAVLAALVAAGFSALPGHDAETRGERFTYLGFLPRQGGARASALADAVATRHTVVLFEAPPRVADTLAELAERGAAERSAVVARELTKKFEEFRRGTVAELAAYYLDAPPRGEIVILLGPVAGEELDELRLASIARTLRSEGRSARDTARLLVDEHGAPRNLAYQLAQEGGVE